MMSLEGMIPSPEIYILPGDNFSKQPFSITEPCLPNDPIFVLYWLPNRDKATTDVGGVGGKSAKLPESDVLVPRYV